MWAGGVGWRWGWGGGRWAPNEPCEQQRQRQQQQRAQQQQQRSQGRRVPRPPHLSFRVGTMKGMSPRLSGGSITASSPPPAAPHPCRSTARHLPLPPSCAPPAACCLVGLLPLRRWWPCLLGEAGRGGRALRLVGRGWPAGGLRAVGQCQGGDGVGGITAGKRECHAPVSAPVSLRPAEATQRSLQARGANGMPQQQQQQQQQGTAATERQPQRSSIFFSAPPPRPTTPPPARSPQGADRMLRRRCCRLLAGCKLPHQQLAVLPHRGQAVDRLQGSRHCRRCCRLRCCRRGGCPRRCRCCRRHRHSCCRCRSLVPVHLHFHSRGRRAGAAQGRGRRRGLSQPAHPVGSSERAAGGVDCIWHE